MVAFYITLPLVFIRFWYLEAPKEQIAFFASLNKSFFQLFSLPLLVRTFFKPIKNEYREGLVGFSIGMGMFIKSCIIPVDIVLFLALLLLEVLFVVSFALFPFVPLILLFI